MDKKGIFGMAHAHFCLVLQAKSSIFRHLDIVGFWRRNPVERLARLAGQAVGGG